MNIVEAIPSTSGSKSEGKVPMNVIMRAQAKQNEQNKISNDQNETKNPGQSKSVRKVMRDRLRAKYHRKLKVVTAEFTQTQEQLQQTLEETPRGVFKEKFEPKQVREVHEQKEVSSGGSILVEKNFEPLDAILSRFLRRRWTQL